MYVGKMVQRVRSYVGRHNNYLDRSSSRTKMEQPIEDKLVQVRKLLDASSSSSSSSSNALLTGRHVMVPFTSKAFFEGRLKPDVCPIAEKGKDKFGTNKLQPKDECILLSLGGDYYAQMNRNKATDLLRRKISEMRMRDKSKSNKAETNCMDLVPNNNATERGLKFSKGFLLDHSTSNSEITEQKNCKTMHGTTAQSCDEASRSTSYGPATVGERQQDSITHYNKNDGTNPASMTISKSTKIVENSKSSVDGNDLLPCLEIREEFDAFGNEIKAEAIDIANELLMLHRTVHNQSHVAKNSTCLQDLHQSFVSENSNDMRSSTYDIEEAEQEQGRGKQMVTDTQYQAICSRLEELSLLEERSEHDKASNEKSSKSLQGKSWSSGFLTKAKSAKPRKPKSTISIPPTTTSSSLSSSTNDKQMTKEIEKDVPEETRKKVVTFRENISDTRYISPISYGSVPSVEEQSSTKGIIPSHPKEINEMTARSINGISSPNSGGLFNSTIQRRQPEDSNNQAVEPLPQLNDIFSGYVMERPVPSKYSPTTNNILLDEAREAGNTTSKLCTTQSKKLSRFARQRREQAH